MNHWKHLNFEHRKIIQSSLAKGFKLIDIAQLINFDPTSISKEIKRNCTLKKQGTSSDKSYPMVDRFPHCCNNCPKRYGNACLKKQFLYRADQAQSNADYLLVHSRVGIDLTEEEFRN